MVEYINLGEYFYIMNRIAYWLVKNNKTFNTRQIYGYFGRVADYGTIINAIRNRGEKVELDGLIAEFVECAIVDNKDLSFLPAYVTCSDGKTKLYLNTYVNMANRVSAYEVLKGHSPNIVYINKEGKISTETPTLDLFERYFGKCEYIDDALTAIQNRGYAYYYNSQYNTVNTITRVVNGWGANCTDISQVFYRLGYDMNNKYGRNYDIQFVHVKCKGGDGHVRLRLRNGSNGDWWYRDPAAVLDGESIGSNWCSPPAYVIAYNPSWIFNDLYQ